MFSENNKPNSFEIKNTISIIWIAIWLLALCSIGCSEISDDDDDDARLFLINDGNTPIGDHEIPKQDIPTRPVYKSPGDWATPAPDSGVDLGFIPVKMYAQVRRSSTVKHLPRSDAIASATTAEEIANAPRLREVVSSKKISEVYSEEGYEDSAYDHAGFEKNAENDEGYEQQEGSRSKTKPNVSKYNEHDSESQGSNVYKEKVGKKGESVQKEPDSSVGPRIRHKMMKKEMHKVTVENQENSGRPVTIQATFYHTIHHPESTSKKPLLHKLDKDVVKQVLDDRNKRNNIRMNSFLKENSENIEGSSTNIVAPTTYLVPPPVTQTDIYSLHNRVNHPKTLVYYNTNPTSISQNDKIKSSIVSMDPYNGFYVPNVGTSLSPKYFSTAETNMFKNSPLMQRHLIQSMHLNQYKDSPLPSFVVQQQIPAKVIDTKNAALVFKLGPDVKEEFADSLNQHINTKFQPSYNNQLKGGMLTSKQNPNIVFENYNSTTTDKDVKKEKVSLDIDHLTKLKLGSQSPEEYIAQLTMAYFTNNYMKDLNLKSKSTDKDEKPPINTGLSKISKTSNEVPQHEKVTYFTRNPKNNSSKTEPENVIPTQIFMKRMYNNGYDNSEKLLENLPREETNYFPIKNRFTKPNNDNHIDIINTDTDLSKNNSEYLEKDSSDGINFSNDSLNKENITNIDLNLTERKFIINNTNNPFNKIRNARKTSDSEYGSPNYLSGDEEENNLEEKEKELEKLKETELKEKEREWKEALRLSKQGNPTPRPYDENKYPFYNVVPSNTISAHTPLRYATNPDRIPLKTEGGMEFYESRDNVHCSEVTPPRNVVPKRKGPGEWNSKPKARLPRLKGLGDKIDCFRTKYFGAEPLDSPFFKEQVATDILQRTMGQPDDTMGFFNEILGNINSIKHTNNLPAQLKGDESIYLQVAEESQTKPERVSNTFASSKKNTNLKKTVDKGNLRKKVQPHRNSDYKHQKRVREKYTQHPYFILNSSNNKDITIASPSLYTSTENTKTLAQNLNYFRNLKVNSIPEQREKVPETQSNKYNPIILYTSQTISPFSFSTQSPEHPNSQNLIIIGMTPPKQPKLNPYSNAYTHAEQIPTHRIPVNNNFQPHFSYYVKQKKDKKYYDNIEGMMPPLPPIIKLEKIPYSNKASPLYNDSGSKNGQNGFEDTMASETNKEILLQDSPPTKVVVSFNEEPSISKPSFTSRIIYQLMDESQTKRKRRSLNEEMPRMYKKVVSRRIRKTFQEKEDTFSKNSNESKPTNLENDFESFTKPSMKDLQNKHKRTPQIRKSQIVKANKNKIDNFKKDDHDSKELSKVNNTNITTTRANLRKEGSFKLKVKEPINKSAESISLKQVLDRGVPFRGKYSRQDKTSNKDENKNEDEQMPPSNTHIKKTPTYLSKLKTNENKEKENSHPNTYYDDDIYDYYETSSIPSLDLYDYESAPQETHLHESRKYIDGRNSTESSIIHAPLVTGKNKYITEYDFIDDNDYTSQLQSKESTLSAEEINRILGGFISRHKPTYSSRYNSENLSTIPHTSKIPIPVEKQETFKDASKVNTSNLFKNGGIHNKTKIINTQLEGKPIRKSKPNSFVNSKKIKDIFINTSTIAPNSKNRRHKPTEKYSSSVLTRTDSPTNESKITKSRNSQKRMPQQIKSDSKRIERKKNLLDVNEKKESVEVHPKIKKKINHTNERKIKIRERNQMPTTTNTNKELITERTLQEIKGKSMKKYKEGKDSEEIKTSTEEFQNISKPKMAKLNGREKTAQERKSHQKDLVSHEKIGHKTSTEIPLGGNHISPRRVAVAHRTVTKEEFFTRTYIPEEDLVDQLARDSEEEGENMFLKSEERAKKSTSQYDEGSEEDYIPYESYSYELEHRDPVDEPHYANLWQEINNTHSSGTEKDLEFILPVKTVSRMDNGNIQERIHFPYVDKSAFIKNQNRKNSASNSKKTQNERFNETNKKSVLNSSTKGFSIQSPSTSLSRQISGNNAGKASYKINNNSNSKVLSYLVDHETGKGKWVSLNDFGETTQTRPKKSRQLGKDTNIEQAQNDDMAKTSKIINDRTNAREINSKNNYKKEEILDKNVLNENTSDTPRRNVNSRSNNVDKRVKKERSKYIRHRINKIKIPKFCNEGGKSNQCEQNPSEHKSSRRKTTLYKSKSEKLKENEELDHTKETTTENWNGVKLDEFRLGDQIRQKHDIDVSRISRRRKIDKDRVRSTQDKSVVDDTNREEIEYNEEDEKSKSRINGKKKHLEESETVK